MLNIARASIMEYLDENIRNRSRTVPGCENPAQEIGISLSITAVPAQSKPVVVAKALKGILKKRSHMRFVLPSLSEVKQRLREPLYKNSFFLLLSSGIGSILGFVFWIVTARLFPASEVGTVSALIAAMALVAGFSRFGFGVGIIRFLSAEEDKTGMINSCLTIVALASLVVSLIFVAGLNFWSPALSFLHQDMPFLISFIVFSVAFSLTIMLNNTYIAFRRAEFFLFQSVIIGLSRIALPVLAVSAAAFGLFLSWGVGLLLTIALGAFLFLPRLHRGYRPLPTIKKKIVKDIGPYSFMNYISMILANLPRYLLPLIIINVLGPETTAYFRMAWTISSVLFVIIPIQVTASLLAEGAYVRQKLRSNVIRAAGLILAIIIPGIAVTFLLGDKILLLFGAAYSENGFVLLRVLALSSIPIAFIEICLTIRQVQLRMKALILVYGLTAVLVLGAIYALIPHYGLIGVGIGWTAGQTIVAVIMGIVIITKWGWLKAGTLKNLLKIKL